ncbi:hypothetical protein Hanom_Chr13g01234661 [Helianthus anomalus]
MSLRISVKTPPRTFTGSLPSFARTSPATHIVLRVRVRVRVDCLVSVSGCEVRCVAATLLYRPNSHL